MICAHWHYSGVCVYISPFLLEEKALLLYNGRNGWESTGVASKQCPDWHPVPILMGKNVPTVPHPSTSLFSQSHPSAPTPRSHPETGDRACCTAPWPPCSWHILRQSPSSAAEAAGLGLPVRTHDHQHLISCCGRSVLHLTPQNPLLIGFEAHSTRWSTYLMLSTRTRF